jgi:hypothetical protein
MAHFDRGVYEPSDDLRVFDGSEDDEDVEGSRLPLLIVLALLVLAMFAGVVWLAYTQGVARGRTETPVLTAQNGPARIAPQNPGGAEQPYKGFKIYEQPAPPDDDADTVTSRGADPVAPPPAAVPKAVATAPAPKPAPVSVVAAPVAPAPAPPVKIAAPVPVKLAPAAVKPPPPVAAKPAAAPVLAKKESPPPSAPVGLATAAPRPLTPVPSMPAAASSPAAAMGGAVLQIGAYKSQAEADAAWKAYKAKHAALLAGATQDVQQADLGDKGTWYRLRLVGFPSKDVALAMCDRLKADGAGCFLGK